MNKQDPFGGLGGASAEMTSSQAVEPAEDAADLTMRDRGLDVSSATDPESAYEAVTEQEMFKIPTDFKPVPKKIVFPRHRVSGRYRALLGSWELELRVDVDKANPANRISGDFYRQTGFTRTYFGSFVLSSPTISYGYTSVTVTGYINSTWTSYSHFLQIKIPRAIIFGAKADATLQAYSGPGGVPVGIAYVCSFESNYFRTVLYEHDRVPGIDAFSSYHTGSLPSGGSSRNLTVQEAFAESGLEVIDTGATNLVSSAAAGASWSDAELHLAMENHFSVYSDSPQWRVWMMEADLHDWGTGLYGIMFDLAGRERQGCAVFHDAIGGTSNTDRRLQLYTYVHEIGHCFNLLHSWQKGLANPPQTNRPNSLSWMNYPWSSAFPGSSYFWNNFAFEFDKPEIVHLRHGYRNNVIMGGADFTEGSALEHTHGDITDFRKPEVDKSNLQLRVETRSSYALGEPVVVDLRLSSTSLQSQRVNARLHPRFDYVRVCIQKPSGEVVLFHPSTACLAASEVVMLDQNRSALYESAYIGYDKRGFIFNQPGNYQVKAVYQSLDGSYVVSDTSKLRVRYPVTAAEERIAALYMGDEQGTLFTFLGSDSPYLQKGNEALDEVISKYKKNPLSAYAAMVRGINAGRDFKTVKPDKAVSVRKSDAKANLRLLRQVIDLSEGQEGVDNITLNMTMRTLANVQEKAGNKEQAKQIRQEMIDIFERKGLRKEVMETIRRQAKES